MKGALAVPCCYLILAPPSSKSYRLRMKSSQRPVIYVIVRGSVAGPKRKRRDVCTNCVGLQAMTICGEGLFEASKRPRLRRVCPCERGGAPEILIGEVRNIRKGGKAL